MTNNLDFGFCEVTITTEKSELFGNYFCYGFFPKKFSRVFVIIQVLDDRVKIGLLFIVPALVREALVTFNKLVLNTTLASL